MSDPVDNPHDALLYIDFMARFGNEPAVVENMKGVADVIRSLMRTVEKQALDNERLEARHG